MLKIAVASDKDAVTEHFGHCENFTIFTYNNEEIINTEKVLNPGHKPGFLPVFLKDLGVNVIISGGMGEGAIEIFNRHNIEVILGASGSSESAAKAFIKGKLKSTGSVCNEHMHKDECGH